MQHQVLFKHLFNKNAWDTDNLLMLQNEAEAYPYFGLIHFFLLKETGIGHGSYTSIAGKLALHFNNPYNLHLKLHQNDTESIVEKQVEISENLVRLETTPETLLTKPVQEKPAEKDALLFEPLFTTDYFASQGIKLSEEIKANDKLAVNVARARCAGGVRRFFGGTAGCWWRAGDDSFPHLFTAPA